MYKNYLRDELVKLVVIQEIESLNKFKFLKLPQLPLEKGMSSTVPTFSSVASHLAFMLNRENVGEAVFKQLKPQSPK